ncbi:MAG TPA: Flp pilus assembly protein CpaB [Chloroflexota bacterium]|nr:Flp pilus assembly protein CpaB [Chloroflexota bacterium]
MRITLVLLLALAAGGGLALGTYRYMQNVPVKTVSMPTKPVVVAATDLELGAQLKADDLHVVEWPASSVPNGAFSTPDEIVGRGLIMPVIQNEPILPMKLAGKDAGSGLPVVIPEGKRAVSVRVNDVIGVAGYVLPGTHVDVLATATPTNSEVDTTTKVVLTNVQVLAAGTKMEQDTEQGKPMAVNVVTLLVSPDEAERLTLGATQGKIQLALRNPLDKTEPETPGIRPAVLLGVASAAQARRSGNASHSRPVATVAAAPTPEPTVEMIRGDKRADEVVR